MSKKLTTAEFVKRAKEVHGDKYDYSITEYNGMTQDVAIICKKHGVFYQKACVHLRGGGCQKCAVESTANKCRLTKESFIQKAIAVHGGKFNYDESIYVNSHTPLKIICPKHGASWQTPCSHLKGHGCERCAAEYVHDLFAKTREEFIKQAIAVHGDKYGYEKVKYTNTETPVIINCKIHGDFTQKPKNHLLGNGCPECWKLELSNKMKMSKEDFIKKAILVHGDEFDYSLVDYTSSDEKVKIICKKHGVFEQDTTNHLRGQGCPACWAERRIGLSKYSNDEFIEKARQKHGNKYDYSETQYDGCFQKVYIICPIHGGFWQYACNHIYGQGCPHCCRSIGEESIKSFLKENDIDFTEQYVIMNESLLCENKRLYVDFYIPHYNTFVEYNGRQHYMPIEHFGGEETYKKQIERDFALRQYCKDHKIKLIEIPYTESENIKDIISKELKLN